MEAHHPTICLRDISRRDLDVSRRRNLQRMGKSPLLFSPRPNHTFKPHQTPTLKHLSNKTRPPLPTQFSGLSITIAQIFSVPPTSYTPTQLGHLNTFPALGAFLAFAILSLLADSTAKYAARRNNRIYEPEFRLYLIAFGLFVGVPGLALFGWYAGTAPTPEQNSQDQISWVIVSFLYGMIIFTTVTQQSTSFAYLLDAHRNVSIETAVFVVMVRNFFSFAAGKFLPAWLNHSGTAKTFYAIAGIQAALVLTTVPLYVFGKVIRSVVHRW